MKFVSNGCYELTGYHPASLIDNKDISFNDLTKPKYQEYLWGKWIKAVNSRLKLTQQELLFCNLI